jgi:hypothetical protein
MSSMSNRVCCHLSDRAIITDSGQLTGKRLLLATGVVALGLGIAVPAVRCERIQDSMFVPALGRPGILPLRSQGGVRDATQEACPATLTSSLSDHKCHRKIANRDEDTTRCWYRDPCSI